jgi:hypothetical protein
MTGRKSTSDDCPERSYTRYVSALASNRVQGRREESYQLPHINHEEWELSSSRPIYSPKSACASSLKSWLKTERSATSGKQFSAARLPLPPSRHPRAHAITLSTFQNITPSKSDCCFRETTDYSDKMDQQQGTKRKAEGGSEGQRSKVSECHFHALSFCSE